MFYIAFFRVPYLSELKFLFFGPPIPPIPANPPIPPIPPIPPMNARIVWARSRVPGASFRDQYINPIIFELTLFKASDVIWLLSLLKVCFIVVINLFNFAVNSVISVLTSPLILKQWKLILLSSLWVVFFLYVEANFHLGTPLFSLTVVTLIYKFGFTDINKHDKDYVSAYSVFNKGRRMLGELDGASLVRQYVGGAMAAFVDHIDDDDAPHAHAQQQRPPRRRNNKKTSKEELNERKNRQEQRRFEQQQQQFAA